MPRLRLSIARSVPSVPPRIAARVRRCLAAWFRRNGRDLPWRRTRDPYAILVSEVMLQQTPVSRVLAYYPRFLSRFPSLRHLAAARPARVMDAWEGLGYYARARNLHALARTVVDGDAPERRTPRGATSARPSPATRNAPTLPADPAELRRLPGVGAYTAGAVASFAFERRAALVDTNVARVLARVFAPRLNPSRASDRRRLWAIAETILPQSGRAAWTHNQALMELGALVCTARVKRCGECPLRKMCPSRET